MQKYTTLITAQELMDSIPDPAIRLVDCRFNLMQPDSGRSEFLAGHIPGAVYAHLDEDLADPIRADSGRHPLPDADRFIRTLARWGVSNDSQVIAYDQGSGAMAARLWWLLRWLGHETVAVLNGGFSAWQNAGGRIETGEPAQPAEGTFTGSPDASMVVTTAELQDNPGTVVLVDARDQQRFLGVTEPIDPVAGHVPGARNLPFSRYLDADGAFLPPDDLRRIWRGVIDSPSEARWAVMCGSGVTACHLALSAAEAGMRPPRLYAGSWSEWIRDPSRPIATEKAVP